jgi:hypothetical protein
LSLTGQDNCRRLVGHRGAEKWFCPSATTIGEIDAAFAALARERLDALELDGEDMRPLPLGERKTKLARLLAGKPAGIVFNEHTDEDGTTVFRHACKLGFEGIVSKRLANRAWTRTTQGEILSWRPVRQGSARHAATEVDEVVKIRSKSLAMEVYAYQAKDKRLLTVSVLTRS